ncbi:MAG TPA: Ig domain-containing protein, partial [Atribacterota bacterium]|nr:Ig domain-containing protein [Atribacterota bacterium]
MKKIFLLSVIIILILFASCAPGTPPAPTPTPSEGEGEEEPTGERVVLVELYNAEGCKASKAVNPIIEQVASEYGTNKVILVELAGWGTNSIPEGRERFSWYVTGTKHTPFIAFNGLSDTISGSGGGGGGGGGGSNNHAPKIITKPLTVAVIGREYSYTVNATDADGDTLTYSLNASPEDMEIDENTGEINWTPKTGQDEDYDVTVEVSDGKLKATQQFTIRVYKEEDFHVSDVQAIAITSRSTDTSAIERKIEYLISEKIVKDSYFIIKPLIIEKGNTDTLHFIILTWPDNFPDATGYRIYKIIDSEYTLIGEKPDYFNGWVYYQDNAIP